MDDKKRIKILVIFVEPMLYNFDLIHEVYEKSSFNFKYIYCHSGLTGRDNLKLPPNAQICEGTAKNRKQLIKEIIHTYLPNFVVINGYVGIEQKIAIKYSQKQKIPYAIESDTPLHIPANPLKALLKKLYLAKILKNRYCYGFPGGTLQKENFIYYGLSKKRCYIMPMTVSEKRILSELDRLPGKVMLREKYGLSEDEKVFLFVGRLEPEKNVDLLIEAFARVKKEHKNISLIIVGDGSLKEKLELQAKQYRMNNILFEGYQVFPKLIEYYKIADIFVLPSYFEPWGLVVNEAMYCGLPVIVSSEVGCRVDLIDNYKNGVVFESQNVKELARLMGRLLESDLKKMGLNSRTKIAEWSFEKYAAQFKKGIAEICKVE